MAVRVSFNGKDWIRICDGSAVYEEPGLYMSCLRDPRQTPDAQRTQTDDDRTHVAEISDVQYHKGESTFFIINMTSIASQRSWKLSKRYSEFNELRLGLEADGVVTPSFPRKHLLRSNTVAVVSQRRAALTEFLNEIVLKHCELPVVADFLDLDNHSRPTRAPQADPLSPFGPDNSIPAANSSALLLPPAEQLQLSNELEEGAEAEIAPARGQRGAPAASMGLYVQEESGAPCRYFVQQDGGFKEFS